MEEYGQLCPLLAPVYFRYGDALLHIVEAKADALAEAGGADSSDEEEEESDGEGGGGGGGGGAGGGNSGAGGEEDLGGEGEEGDNDDEVIAFELLDVARVLYSRITPATPATALDLARTQLRLGDLYAEGDKFEEAVAEYKACLEARKAHLPRHDRRIADALSCLANTYMQLASGKEVGEAERRIHLSSSLLHTQGAAEVLAALAVERAREAAALGLKGADAFHTGASAEVGGGALRFAYPPGRTTSILNPAAIGVGGVSPAAAAAAAAAAPSSGDAPSGLVEPDIVVFTTLFDTHLAPHAPAPAPAPAPAAAAAAADPAATGSSSSSSSSSSAAPADSSAAAADPVAAAYEELQDLAGVVDALLLRAADISADLGVSVSSLLAGISAAAGVPDGGVTVIGFGDAAPAAAAAAAAPTAAHGGRIIESDTIGFGDAAAAAPAEVGAVLMARKRPADAGTSGVKRKHEDGEGAAGDGVTDASAAKAVRTE